ncbi:MAG: helix-turn-helix transcriptional regulator [Thiohalorhabdus sp.]|uniref:S24 family peptidase n=1 Tax=Thiohalorhabdus sp. TaxID=3094134 RepID=UPI0039803DE7
MGERIAALADGIGGKRRLAALAGIRESQLFRYIRGDNIPSLATAAALADAGGVSLEWLAYGSSPGGGHDSEGLRDRSGGYTAEREWMAPFRFDDGPAPLRFQRAWLESLRLDPESLLLTECPDDAMAPTLQPHDLVLADARSSRVEAAGLYLFEQEGIAVPRRAVPLPDGALRLACDNPVYPELTLSREERAGLRVLGRIAWAGRRY